MSDNTQEIPVLVTYYTNSRILCKKEFGSFAHFGSILNYFERFIKNNSSQINLKQKYFLNEKEIEDNDLLINLIQSLDKNKDKNRIITEANLSIEIEEEQKNNLILSKNNNTSIYSKILQPKPNPFGIYVLNPKDYSIFLKEFPLKVEKENELNKLNENSAYCNSTKDLYISGGIYCSNHMTEFWIINNVSFCIKKLYMNYPKVNHSMIYINNDEKELIFIAGGDDLKSFYYDISINKFVNWGNMNHKHFRPALIHIGDYLYCFDISENYKLIFERANLNDISKKWENFVPDFENKKLKNFTNVGFAASVCINGKILFCGGDSVNINTYIYDVNKNIISSNDNNEDILFTFADKNFYKINNNSSIALPNSLDEEKEILISNKNKFSLDKINLNKKVKNKNEKFIFNNKYLIPQESLIGNVNIEFKTEDINDEKENVEINDIGNISNIDNIDYIDKSIIFYPEIKTKTIKSCFTYIANNDNFSNYKKEKNLKKNNDIIIKYDKENSKENKRIAVNREKIKIKYTETKSLIKLNFNDFEGFFEAEGNNFIYDSNSNKFNDIKANNEFFSSYNITRINKIDSNNKINNKIKKDNKISNYINSISNNKHSINKENINNIESDIKININNDNNIFENNEINNINKDNKKEKEIMNKAIINNNLGIIDIEKNMPKENNPQINDNNKLNDKEKDLNFNLKEREENEKEELFNEYKNNPDEKVQKKSNEEFKEIEEFEKEEINERQIGNNDKEHDDLDKNKDKNIDTEKGDFIEASYNENEEENNNNEENPNFIEDEEMNEDGSVEEYKDEMEVDEKEENENYENEERIHNLQDKDTFEQIITQKMGENIIPLSKDYDLFYYDENNFCDYYCIVGDINF